MEAEQFYNILIYLSDRAYSDVNPQIEVYLSLDSEDESLLTQLQSHAILMMGWALCSADVETLSHSFKVTLGFEYVGTGDLKVGENGLYRH